MSERNPAGDEPTMPGIVPPPPGPWVTPEAGTPVNGPFPPAPPAQQPVSQPPMTEPLPEPPMVEQPWQQAQSPAPQWGQPPVATSGLPSWDAAQPNSGGGYWTPPGPTSAPPQSGAPSWNDAPPPPAPAKPRTGNTRTAVIAALIVLPLAFGAGGFFLGRAQGGGSDTPDTKPSAGASLAPYEATQRAINEKKFDADTSAIAGPWLNDAGGCVTNTEPGGPKLPADEKAHVFCRYGGVSVHFASYREAAQRDAARGWRQQLSVQNGSLAQGMELPAKKNGGITGAPGTYVEYALKGTDGQTFCGIWWDRDNELSAVYMEALCQQTLGGNLAPLRDLWERHS